MPEDPCIDIQHELGLDYDCEEVSYQSVLEDMTRCRGIRQDASSIREVVELELKIKTKVAIPFPQEWDYPARVQLVQSLFNDLQRGIQSGNYKHCLCGNKVCELIGWYYDSSDEPSCDCNPCDPYFSDW
jgi:hypothetical protein